jgi:formylglycine-generating enzyme required for sulfatase activity
MSHVRASDDPQPQAKGQADKANAWGVRNMLAGAREWCLDWFGEYQPGKQVDPVGPATGNVRIVRGGILDLDERNSPKIDFWQLVLRTADWRYTPGMSRFSDPDQRGSSEKNLNRIRAGGGNG